MSKRNGRSDYRCPACGVTLGHIRRTAVLLRQFVPTPTTHVRYLSGGVLELHCQCGKVTKLHWLAEVV